MEEGEPGEATGETGFVVEGVVAAGKAAIEVDVDVAEFVLFWIVGEDGDLAAGTLGTLTRRSVTPAVLSAAVLPFTSMVKYLAVTGGKS